MFNKPDTNGRKRVGEAITKIERAAGEQRTYRVLEAVAIVGSVAAILSTYFLIGRGAPELNPIAEWLLADPTSGSSDWFKVAAGRLVLATAAVFTVLRAVSRRWPRYALTVAIGAAAAHLLNGLNDVAVLLQGFPDSFVWSNAIPVVGFTLLLASVLASRHLLLDALERIRERLPRRAIGSLVIALLLATSIVAVPFAPIGTVEADHDSTKFDLVSSTGIPYQASTLTEHPDTGNFWVLDNDAGQFKIYDPSDMSTAIDTVGYSGPAGNEGIEFGPNGYIWVIDRNNERLYKLDPNDGSHLATQNINADANAIYGLSIDRDGQRWIVSDTNDDIYVYDYNWNRQNKYTTSATSGSSQRTEYVDGTLYMLDNGDTSNDEVYLFNGTDFTHENTYQTASDYSHGLAKRDSDGHWMIIDRDANNFEEHSGQPTTEPVSGTVTDTAGNAQSGVTVEATDDSGTVVDSTSTDSNGDYELGVPDPATYEITADDGDHSSTKTVDVPDGGKTGVDFEIGPTVTGKVTDGDGNVLENVAVGADDSSVETDYTNATGEYELLFPGTGTYEITADNGDYVSTKTVDVQTGGVSGINFKLGPGNPDGQPVGLLEDDYGIFPADDTDLVVYERSTEYKSVEEGMSVRTWHEDTWTKTETATFNWENRTHVDLVHGRYYRLELDSASGSWEDSGFLYNDTEMSGSTNWLEPDPSSTDTNGDGTTGGSGSSGTNARDYDSTATPTADENGTYPTATEQQGFGPTALGKCTTLDGQDGVEVEYWDPNYETAELEANLTVDDSTTYYVHKIWDDPRGYYRGCIADSMTDNASSEGDLGLNHSALDGEGNVVSTGSKSFSAPTFGPSGKAPASTAERAGLLAAVLGALGVLWFGGNRYVPASSVKSWPSESISPAFAIGGPVVAVLGLDLAGGGVISAGVATGLAQIAPFAGIVGVTVGGYYALRWIRAPPSA